jgi:serine/threonine protein kinase/WD40 repeat protein
VTLPSGSRLGPYEILAPLGAGGMGEVYRARDSRLGRDVAIKVLPAELSSDAGRLKRFEKEARSASALNHPNIVTIYEIGSADSVSYLAMELVEGKTLRELLFAGPLPVKRVLSIAAQIAEGLARAHEAGIVHRDLKPENVMVTKDGRLKILDFGLAKQTYSGPDSGEGTNLPTETGTDAGVILGTVGYMSPEQASGQTVDFRSDQFSFGSILYELLTGRRAFAKPTGAQTLAAIIQDEPEPLGALSPQVPAQLRWLVERCLSKAPEDRYGTTRDLAVELRTIRDHLSEALVSETAGVAGGALRPRALWRRWLVPIAALSLFLLGAWLLTLRSRESTKQSSSLRFQQITFSPSDMYSARFAPDGQTIVYGMKPVRRPIELYSTRIGSREFRRMGVTGDIRGISSTGEMVILETPFVWGTLRVASLAGGGSRELLEEVRDADWSPDGKTLAVVRRIGGKNRIEFPIGKVLYDVTAAAHRIRGCRVSRDGQRVAFVAGDRLNVVDLAGKVKDLTRSSGHEFVWSPNGDEIWFSRFAHGTTDLYAVTPDGRERKLVSVPGTFYLYDVSREGRLLLQQATQRWMVFGRFPDDQRDRNLSVRDVARPADLSPDGKWLLLHEIEPGWDRSTIYVRNTDGSDAVRVGDGFARAISPDGQWVLAFAKIPATQYFLLPRGAGEARTLPNDGFEAMGGGTFLPGGKAIAFSAHLPGRRFRIYLQDLDAGRPRPITPEGVRISSAASPDGKHVVGTDLKGQNFLYPIDGGEPRPVTGLEGDDQIVQWSADGRSLYVFQSGDLPRKIWLLDIMSGRRKVWREIESTDPARTTLDAFLVTPDGRSYVHAYENWLADLYLAEGVR